MVDVGSPAPDFELTWKVGSPPVRRSSHQAGSPLVLLFFPLAFSGVCTEEMCSAAEHHGAWEELGARVLGVSVDSPWVNVRFAEETGARFPILSDFNRTVAAAYGVLNDDFFGMKGVAHRSAFVIDGAGVVRYAWTTLNADVLPDFDEVRAAVAAL